MFQTVLCRPRWCTCRNFDSFIKKYHAATYIYIYIYILHPRCRMRFYTHRARPARTEPANPLASHPKQNNGRTHARHTHARTNPHPQPARGHPVTADHAPHPLTVDRSLSLSSIHFRLLLSDPLFVRSRHRRFLQGDSGGAGVGGGVGLRRRLGLSICTGPFFLPPASTSCLLTHSSRSRDRRQG
jgi:hypothetical protein